MAEIANFPTERAKRKPGVTGGEATVTHIGSVASPQRESVEHEPATSGHSASTTGLTGEPKTTLPPAPESGEAQQNASAEQKKPTLKDVVWQAIPEMRTEAAELKKVIESIERKSFNSADELPSLRARYDYLMTLIQALCAAY